MTTPEPENPEEPEDDAEQELCDGIDEVNSASMLHMDTCLMSDLSLKDEDEGELIEENNIPCQTEEKDSSGDSSESVASCGEGGSPNINRTLPDVIKIGRPLGRRRTLGHVSDTVG